MSMLNKMQSILKCRLPSKMFRLRYKTEDRIACETIKTFEERKMKLVQIKKKFIWICVWDSYSGSISQKLICCAENFNELVGSAIKQVQEQKTALKYNLNETKRIKNARQKRKQVGKHDKIFS